MHTVTITECSSKGREWSVKAASLHNAVRRLFGPHASFVRNGNIVTGCYGQIVRRCQGSGTWNASAVTDRVRVTIH
jgi:hypothetical protein